VRRIPIATALMLLILSAPAIADIHMVWPDGIGPYPNIQAAIDASAYADTIMLIEGYFSGPGNRDLQIPTSRTFIGFGEPGSNIIDAEGEVLATMGVDPDPSEHFYFQGITFLNGQGLTAQWDKKLHFNRCRFENCEGVAYVTSYVIPSGLIEMVDCDIVACTGGTLISTHRVEITNCRFTGNTSEASSGLELVYSDYLSILDSDFEANVNAGVNTALVGSSGGDTYSGEASIRDCRFTSNQSGYCVMAFRENALIEGCRFENNLSHGIDLYAFGGEDYLVEVRDCVFLGNAGMGILCYDIALNLEGSSFVQGGGVADLVVWSGPAPKAVSIDRCLFAFNPTGPALLEQNLPAALQVDCTDIFGNAGGDWVGSLAPWLGMNGNFSANPLFCDWAADDITLYDTSPCLPSNNSCAVQIGAEGQGCTDLTAVEPTPGARIRFAAHPNPFNPATRFSIDLPEAGPVTLTVHDAAGRRVATLLDMEYRSEGVQLIDWRAEGLPSGVYMARLMSGATTYSEKLILLR
jgi:hypothetical protein